MKRISTLSATFFIAASCAAAPAVADPAPGTICDPNPATNPGYDASFCAKWTEPATSTGHRGVVGIGDWFSDHAGWIIAAAVLALIVAVACSVARDRDEEAKQRKSAAIARGRRIAQDHYARRVADARAAVPVPDPATYDPHGLGIAPPPQSEPKLPDPPPMSEADLKRYAEFGWAVPWVPDTAFAAVVTPDGDTTRIEKAWVEACQLAGLGDIDPESGTFTPAATVVNVNGIKDSGDVRVAVDTRDYTVGAKQLDDALEHLIRTARVESATPFERDAAKDWFITVLSMEKAPTAPVPQVQQSAPDQPAVDPKWS